MTDLVKRLRESEEWKLNMRNIREAADRIEELEALLGDCKRAGQQQQERYGRVINRLNCKYEALVGKIRDAMEEYECSYEPETIELIDNISTLLEDNNVQT